MDKVRQVGANVDLEKVRTDLSLYFNPREDCFQCQHYKNEKTALTARQILSIVAFVHNLIRWPLPVEIADFDSAAMANGLQLG